MLQNQSGMAFGEYQLLRPVGWGGMSVVYHALQATPESDVLAPGNVSEFAVKVMVANKDDSLSYYRRFQREVKVASSLAHPHILPVCTYGIAHNHLYLVMPYMKSGTLEHRLRERRVLSLNETLTIAKQIGQALDYAHSRNIIHRDVKPHNIMIGGKDQYYLADFGLVKILDGATRLTMSGHIIGTPAYMCPEQANGEPVDHRSDVYSLGIVLYECLVGRLPYPFETQAQAIGQHLSAQAMPPRSINPEFPKEVERVLMRALQKDPAKRYDSAGQLAAALARAANDCKPAIRENALVTLEQVERSRTLPAPRTQTTVKNPNASKVMWAAVGVSVMLWLVLAVTIQTRLWNPEEVLAIIIQDVNAVQTTFKQTFLIPPERVVLTHPIEHKTLALPSRPFQQHQDEGLPETTFDQGQREEEIEAASETELDDGTAQPDESSDNAGTVDSSDSTSNRGNQIDQALNGGNGGATSGSGGGNTNGNGSAGNNGSGNDSSTQGNGNGNANGGGNGNGSTDNGDGTSTQGNGNGNANDNGNAGSSGNDQSTDTGNGNGSTDNGSGTSAQGNGNGNVNGGGNDKEETEK